MTLEEILADPVKHAELVKLSSKRYNASADYNKPWHERWVRFYKIYRAIMDAVDDPDEPNTGTSYCFGVIEDLVSAIVEPILQLKPPCRVTAKVAGHEKMAENFANVCSNYFQTSRYQLEFTTSTREQIILGNAWERDGWANDWIEGRKWAYVPKTGILDKVKSFFGKDIDAQTPYSYQALEEVPHKYPERVGYYTAFPWAFDIYPEPGVRNVRDMHWLIEREKRVAIDDLKKKMYIDKETKESKPLFDFTKMLEAVGDHAAGTIQPTDPSVNTQSDYGEQALQALSGSGQRDDTASNQNLDMDMVSLQWHWEKNRFWVIANDAYVVCYQENLFHVPRIPYRLKVYTPQKEFLYGLGAIEPIESQLLELDDIHKLSMRNWMRIINKMVAYNEDAIPFTDDFKYRAGGKIRVRPASGTNVQNEIVAFDQPDVTRSMLTQESNTKGLIERIISVADLSPGVEGTKQNHKTLGGLMEISRKVAKRTTTVRRMILAGFQDQMWFMEKLYTQFQFEKQPFTAYGPDGSTSIQEMDMWDIQTGGVGFDFVIEYDPSFGDDALLRNQMMVLLDLSIKYEGARLKFGDPTQAKANIEDVMRRTYKSFGWNDTSAILVKPDGMVTPDSEFKQMMNGTPVMPKPGEDLVNHLIEHYVQLNSPKLQKGIELGRVNPRVIALLQAHIQATEIRIMKIMQNPMMVAQAKVAASISAQGMMGNPDMNDRSQMAAPPVDTGNGAIPPRAGMPAGMGAPGGQS